MSHESFPSAEQFKQPKLHQAFEVLHIYTDDAPSSKNLFDQKNDLHNIAITHVIHGFLFLSYFAKNSYIREAAKDMHEITTKGQVEILLDTEEKIPALFPANHFIDDSLSKNVRPLYAMTKDDAKKPSSHALIIPKLWVLETTRKNPVEALTFLATAGSYMRDGYYEQFDTHIAKGKLYTQQELRAGSIASDILNQAEKESFYSFSPSSAELLPIQKKFKYGTNGVSVDLLYKKQEAIQNKQFINDIELFLKSQT